MTTDLDELRSQSSDIARRAASTYLEHLVLVLQDEGFDAYELQDARLDPGLESSIDKLARYVLQVYGRDILALAREDDRDSLDVADEVLDFILWDPDPAMFISVPEATPARERLHDLFLSSSTEFGFADRSAVFDEERDIIYIE